MLMTENAVNSPFVYHEILFADWLGKKLVTVMFKNTWSDLRPSLRAVLGRYNKGYLVPLIRMDGTI